MRKNLYFLGRYGIIPVYIVLLVKELFLPLVLISLAMSLINATDFYGYKLSKEVRRNMITFPLLITVFLVLEIIAISDGIKIPMAIYGIPVLLYAWPAEYLRRKLGWRRLPDVFYNTDNSKEKL